MKMTRSLGLWFPAILLTGSPIYADLMTSFDEGTLPAGLSLDIPNASLATITLDTVAAELTMETTGNTDLWTSRRDAPFAWTARPVVEMGEKWYAETEVRYNGATDGLQRVAGIAFYADSDGVGGSSGGMDFSFGLNDWDNRGIEVQGLGGSNAGDSAQRFINWGSGNPDPQQAQLRVEVEELGNIDGYVFFYRLNGSDPWVELASFNSVQDNSRVTLFFKNGGGTAEADRSVSFSFFNVGPLVDGESAAPQISGLEYDDQTGQFSLTWSSAPGASYSVNYSTDLVDWSAEIEGAVPATDGTTTFQFPNPLNEYPVPRLFFRVERN